MRHAELLDTEHDRAAFDRLSDTIASRNALALVGAGFSARAGYPQWNELLKRMTDLVEEHARSVVSQGAATVRALPETLAKYDDVLWRAEELRDRLHDDRYFALIQSVFAEPPQQDDCIDMLVGLPFRHLITTNYDQSLELAYERIRKAKIAPVNWADEPEVLRMMFSLVQSDAQPRLVYLHGRADDCRTIVLTDQDYSRQYVRSDSTVRKLFALFAMHRIVFFGFSLTDPDLLAILRQVAGALGYGEPRHFAFVPIDEGKDREVDRKRLARKFGISAIFYDRANRHERLKELMKLLVERCEGKAATPFAAAVAEAPRLRKVAEPAPPALQSGPSPVRPHPVPAPSPRKSRTNDRFPDDPRKEMFGGQSTAGGRTISATVTPIKGDRDWFDVEIVVRPTPGAPPLAGKVTFYLHPTFSPPIKPAVVRGGVASIELVSYGAFTVGAVADDGATELELDLATIKDAPKRFLEN